MENHSFDMKNYYLDMGNCFLFVCFFFGGGVVVFFIIFFLFIIFVWIWKTILWICEIILSIWE